MFWGKIHKDFELYQVFTNNFFMSKYHIDFELYQAFMLMHTKSITQ